MSNVDDLLNAPTEQGGTPLIEFKGTLKDVSLTTGEGNRQKVLWDFVDLEVIESREPYPFPIYQYQLNYANRKNTGYTAWKESLEHIIQGPISVDMLKGKEFHVKKLPTQIRGPLTNPDGSPKIDEKNPLKRDGITPNQEWGIVLMDIFQVVGIEGYSTPEEDTNQMKDLAKLADGKSEEEFYMAIMQDGKLKGNSELINAVVNRKLLPAMLSGGFVHVDNGKLVAI